MTMAKARVPILIVVVLLLAAFSLVGGKYPPGEIIGQIFSQSFGSADSLGFTFKEMTPLLICGVGVFLALRAGLFNIGIEGQFMMGALASAVIALRVPGPLAIPLALIGGAVAGALWAYPAGVIKAFRNGHEVITTIMLNEVARQLSTALLAGPFKSPTDSSPATAEIPASAQLPMLVSSPSISLGLILGITLLAGIGFWLRRTVKGYEHEAVGANASAAQFAGINAETVTWRSMVWSGAIGGFGGAIQVLAYEHRCYEGFSSGYGFDSLGVALLAATNPLGIVPAALAFGALKQGVSAVGILYEVPKGIGFYLLGLTLIAFAAIRYRKQAEREVV
jgi:general nucleoside transport system permease protein